MASDVLKRIGMNTDFQALEWGTVVQRRASKEAIDKGGWNVFHTISAASATSRRRRTCRSAAPAATEAGSAGRTTRRWRRCATSGSTRPTSAAQKKICEAMQVLFWHNPPYAPLGMYELPTAFHSYLEDVRDGWSQSTA